MKFQNFKILIFTLYDSAFESSFNAEFKYANLKRIIVHTGAQEANFRKPQNSKAHMDS